MEEMIPNNSDLLQSYLDGELDSSMETKLFSELNASSDLRSEMCDLLAMKRAVRQDKAALVPPVATTAALFGALGLSAPLAWSSAWWSALWSKAWIPIATALVGSSLTWYTIQRSAPQSEASQQVVVSIQRDTVRQAPIHDTVVVTKYKSLYASEQREPEVRTVNRYVYVVDSSPTSGATSKNNVSSELNENNNISSSAPSAPPADIVLTDNSVKTTMSPLMVRRVSPSGLESSSVPDAVNGSRALMPELQAVEIFPKWSFQARGLSSTSLVSVNAQPETSALYSNSAYSLLYRPSQNFGVGVEVGSETFAMNFKGYKDGLLQQYEVYPSLTWASVAFQYRLDPSSGWQPFAQLNAGATSYGPVAKMLAGTYYAPIANLKLILGLEASSLFYSVPSTGNYMTPKLGLTYGLSYQF